MAKEIAEDYASSLADLTVNSKPLINMLTILAEENIEHAGVIVETVEKHLEKVHSDIKLPVLYLVDSIIKNVGSAYIQKFSSSIVNMFTRTFKQVDEKTRSQMFKLRETWHDVFPATKMYQLDVKVNLIDPAWPIQAQPQQSSSIHVNPNFLKKPVATTSTVPVVKDEEQMRVILAKKEQELLMLQKKKIDMELEQTRRQLELAEKQVKKTSPGLSVAPPVYQGGMPVAMVNPVVPPAPMLLPPVTAGSEAPSVPVKQRLGPPVNSGKSVSSARIAPISGAMLAAARRDPRLARHQAHHNVPPSVPVVPRQQIAPNDFDIKPLERVTKRKNVITIDVNVPERERTRDPRRRDPRLEKRSKDVDERRRNEKRIKDGERFVKKSVEEKARKLAEKRLIKDEEKREEKKKSDEADSKIDGNNFDINTPRSPKTNNVDEYISQIADAKKVNKLPPIPKISRNDDPKTKEEVAPSLTKKTKKEIARDKKKKRDANKNDKDSNSSDSLSPEKRSKSKEVKESRKKQKPQTMEVDAPTEEEVVAFKELKNYHKERYMRRNKEPSESPEKIPEAPKLDVPPPPEIEPSNVSDVVVENKDVDLRVLHPAVVEAKAAPVGQKRSSTETVEGKAKKSKLDKFDILFGNEDVDLRQLPQVEETIAPVTIESPKRSPKPEAPNVESPKTVESPQTSPVSPKQKDWQEVKDSSEEPKKPSKLDLVRAKLAEATKGKDLGKDRLGRPLLFTKSPSLERERRRTISTEDTDLRTETEDEVNKETISLILSQAKEHFKDGKMDKNQYNTLMFQVMQLNEKLKLKEAKQRESLEISKRKLHRAQKVNEENSNPKLSPNHNRFGDVDERIIPPFVENPPNSQDLGTMQDYDMRVGPNEQVDGPMKQMIPRPPMPPMFMGPYPPMPMWRGMRPRGDDFGGPRRPRLPLPPFFRNKFDKRPRPPFDRYGPHPAPPKIGTCQGENPLPPYRRGETDPPPLGTPGVIIPPTDHQVIEYIDNDPMKTIEIDGVPREIRFYGESAVIMLDWDDPREIKFLPGARRITFDNKDSVVLKFNEGYEKVEIDDDVFDIRFGAPTRELYINGRWYECFFGGPPSAIVIDGKPRMIQLEGPPPQVDIGKDKRTDLVAGKINLIVDAQHMCPVFLDAKVQKFLVDGNYYTIRFVDSLKTVLINEVPFEVEFGGLPRPIFIGQNKHFIRFSVLPRHVKPGQIEMADMEGKVPEPEVPGVSSDAVQENKTDAMETDEEMPRPEKIFSPDGENSNHGGLDMLASVMPSEMAPASSFSGYSLAEPLFSKTDKIPGLEGQTEETKQSASTTLPILGNINVNDLFAKLVATGIVSVAADKKEEVKDSEKKEPAKPKEDNTVVHPVDLLRPETLRVKQPAIVSKLYGGMQCSGCGARFPPEHTVRYSQHLDWHFRQNRRERDSARRAHSRHWHYDLSDWVQYEEVEDLEEREKSWFETGGAEGGEGEGPTEATPTEVPSVPAGLPAEHVCELCGDKFDQFYNEDKEEWHLRKAVRHEDKNYHPLCFEDYKASLAKEEKAPDASADDVVAIDKTEEPIEIKDTDDVVSQSDTDDVVEVLDETRGEEGAEPVEIDEGEEDDVIYKAEPVDEVTVDDDADTDDETQAERRARDEKAEFDYRQIKVKQEPLDPDDEPVITAEEEAIRAKPDTTSTTVLSSIDGNVQLETAAQVAPAIPTGGIRINISKSVPSFVAPVDHTMLDDISVDDEPPPPGEEPELVYTIKESLKGAEFSRQPPIQKGSELSGLCSIM